MLGTGKGSVYGRAFAPVILSHLVVVLCHWTNATPIPTAAPVTIEEARRQLARYGYAGSGDEAQLVVRLRSVQQFRAALRKYQQFGSLRVTGLFDLATRNAMGEPRCGCKDIETSEGSRKKRQIPVSGRWPRTSLQYSISQYYQPVARSTLDEVVRSAFQTWSSASALRFTRVSQQRESEIDISFATRDHGDGNPFDGPGRTLGHAFRPDSRGRRGNILGDVHFDAEDTFRDSSRPGRFIQLRPVMVHEIGHALGLGHSRNRNSIMFARYQPINGEVRLGADDRSTIQRLYPGTPVVPGTPSPPPVPTFNPGPQRPFHCINPRVDALFTRNSDTYAFLGSTTLQITNSRVVRTARVSQVFRRTSRVDAALVYGNYIFLFNGANINVYFRSGRFLVLSTRISRVFAGVPNNIDAAFRWTDNRHYIFKDNQYWRLGLFGARVEAGPLPLSDWGLVTSLPSAGRLRALTTFPLIGPLAVYGSNAYLITGSQRTVNFANPRPVASTLFGCN